jgi:hypothetical protein
MATSKLGVAIDTLVAYFTTALPGVTVLDGELTGEAFPAKWLIVGDDGVVAEDEVAATSKQVWAGIGAKTRDEVITVTCAAGAWTGNAAATRKSVRDDALAVMAAAEQALRNDPSLGSITQGGAQITDADLHNISDPAGIGVALVFMVTVPFRLER